MERKKLHKTLLILTLVIVPPYFLIFTDEGARISDNVVLWLFGEEYLDRPERLARQIGELA